MPTKPSRLCPCGRTVPGGERCACQAKRDAERRARFDRTRPTASARGYDRDWQKARARFLRSHPTCVRCSAPATVVDHVQAHRGDPVLFWDRTNWQGLCAHHHNGAKQREERSSPRRPSWQS